jgi:hypothetical protein
LCQAAPRADDILWQTARRSGRFRQSADVAHHGGTPHARASIGKPEIFSKAAEPFHLAEASNWCFTAVRQSRDRMNSRVFAWATISLIYGLKGLLAHKGEGMPLMVNPRRIVGHNSSSVLQGHPPCNEKEAVTKVRLRPVRW